MTRPPVTLNPLTKHSWIATQDGQSQPFAVRETTEGWKTEGSDVYDGLLFDTREALIAHCEGRSA